MRNLMTALIALPLLTSCEIVQQEYYDSGYYNPPPQVEVVRPYRYYQDGRIHRMRPRRGHQVPVRPGPGVIRPRPQQLPPNVQQIRPVQPYPENPRAGVVVPTPSPQAQVQPNRQIPVPAPRANIPVPQHAPTTSAPQVRPEQDAEKPKNRHAPVTVSSAPRVFAPGALQVPRPRN